MDTAHGWVPILKQEKQTDGTLIVEGIATDSSLDRDKQIADPGWLAKAMPAWFREGGNIREQHNPRIAAGVAMEYAPVGDDHRIRARIVDPSTVAKLEHGVLKGFSFGARNARITTDKSAAGGRIVDGQIYEVSVVDRPANPNCVLTIAKADGTGELQLVDAPELEETRFTPSDMAAILKSLGKAPAEKPAAAAEKPAAEKPAAAAGAPIKTVGDLKAAIKAVGTAKDPAAAKALIKRRAAALGREDLVAGDAFKADDEPALGEPAGDPAGDDPAEQVHDPAEIGAVRDGLIALIRAELDELMNGEDELGDVQGLLCALQMLMNWWQHEAIEGETANPYPKDDDAGEDDPAPVTIQLADTGANTPDPVPTDGTLTKTDVAALIDAAITKAVKPYEDALKAVKGELAQVKATPMPGGPARIRTSSQTAIAAKADALRVQEDHLTKMAGATSGPLQAGYRERLKVVQAELTALNGGQ